MCSSSIVFLVGFSASLSFLNFLLPLNQYQLFYEAEPASPVIKTMFAKLLLLMCLLKIAYLFAFLQIRSLLSVISSVIFEGKEVEFHLSEATLALYLQFCERVQLCAEKIYTRKDVGEYYYVGQDKQCCIYHKVRAHLGTCCRGIYVLLVSTETLLQ